MWKMEQSLPPDDILIQVTPRLPIADVWNALVRPEHLVKWLAPKATIEAWEGGAIELAWDDDSPLKGSTVSCKITKFERQDEIDFTWRAPEKFDKLMNQGAPQTEVFLTVSTCPEGIDVTLEHKGWQAGEDWEAARSWHFHFWDDALHRFRDYVMDDKTVLS